MQLPISMPGLGHVNCYALIDGRARRWSIPVARHGELRALQDRLKQAGVRLKHVHTVIVTHSHPDHFGGATRFVRESGARVVGHRNFRFGLPSAATPEVSAEHLGEKPAEDEAAPAAKPAEKPAARGGSFGPWNGPTPWGGTRPRPPFKQRMRWRMMRTSAAAISCPRSRTRSRTATCCGSPAATGSCCTPRPHRGPHLPARSRDGDLPRRRSRAAVDHAAHLGISSSRDPLASFFYSLDRVAEINGIKHALPANGHPFTDLKARTEAIKRHHFERLEKIREISRELGPASVEDISKKLFKPRSWGSMAESETYAHLEHLRLAGQAESRREGEKLIYNAG
jgi:hypothetical protein